MTDSVTRYSTSSPIGLFVICQRLNGRWHIIWNNEDLGSYANPGAALDDLVGGHTESLSNGVDTASLGLADDLGGWQWHRGSTP